MKTTSSYFETYTELLTSALKTVDVLEFEKAHQLLFRAYEKGNEVYVGGNGGSAAISDHFNCDHAKGVLLDTNLKPRVYNLVGSVALNTAIANDIGYDDVLAFQIRARAKPLDVAVLISSSGNSPNIVKAAKQATKEGMYVIGMTGFDGGELKKLSMVSLHVNSNNYGVIEDTHQAIMHALSQTIRIKQRSLNKPEGSLKL